MKIKAKNEEEFKFIYIIRQTFPTSDLFYSIFFIMKFIGIILSTHNIKGLESTNSNRMTITTILEKFLVFHLSFNATSFYYQTFSILFFILLVFITIGLVIIWMQIFILYSHNNDVYDTFLIKTTKNMRYIIYSKTLSFLTLIIALFSQHLIEYLSFGVFYPFMKLLMKDNHSTFKPNLIQNLNNYHNQEYINCWALGTINFFSEIIICCFVFLFLLLNSTKSIFLRFGTSLYSNIKILIFLIIFSIFQSAFGIQNIYIDKVKIIHRFYLDIIGVFFLSLFLLCNIKQFNSYNNFVPKMNMYLLAWSWYSGLLELPIYYLCKSSFSQSYSFLKMLIEIISAGLIIMIIDGNNKKYFSSKFSLNLFQNGGKKVSIGEIYNFIELLNKFIKNPKKNYFAINNIIQNHRLHCQNANCPCSIVNHFQINEKSKISQLTKSELEVKFLSKEDLIIICEQEIVNRIYALSKRKSSKYELSNYCILHVQYIYFIKKQYYFALYLTNQYLFSKVKMDFISRYFLFEIKKQIMKEIHNIMNRKNSHRMGLYIVPDQGDNKDIKELKKFFGHTVFIESIKKLMVECCECIDKILKYKNEFYKNSKISIFSGAIFSSFISLCETIMTNKKKINYLVLNYSKNEIFNDVEICYFLYHFFQSIFKSIPREIKGKFQEISTYKSYLTKINNSKVKNNNFFSLIIRIQHDDNFEISYISYHLSEKLNYSKEKLIGADFHCLLPNDLKENHKIIMKRFLFLPNPIFNKEQTFLLDNNKHLFYTSMTVKVLPDFKAAFYLIANVQPIEIYSDFSISYYLMLNRDFKFLSISPNFENQFFFTLKMFDILKITFCDFFGISINHLKSKLKEKQPNFAKDSNLMAINKANSIFCNINQEKMFSYRKIPKENDTLFHKSWTYTELINKNQILQGLSNLVKTIDEIGLDIEWYGRVKCLKERLRLSSAQANQSNSLNKISTMTTLNSNSFEISYISRDLGSIRYYIANLVEFIDVKEITISTMNLRELLISRYDYQTKKSIHKKKTNFPTPRSVKKISNNWSHYDQSDLYTQGSNQKSGKISSILDSGNLNMTQNSTYNQSTNSKLTLVKNTSPSIMRLEPYSRSNINKLQFDGQSNLFSLIVNEKEYFLNEKKRKFILEKMKNSNFIYIKVINFIFFLICIIIVLGLILKNINLHAHKNLFYINAYTEMLKTDIYLAGLVTINLCRQLAFSNSTRIQFFRINYQIDNLIIHFALFQNYISKFTGNKKLKHFYNILYEINGYNIIKQNWESISRQSTLTEEINMFRYYANKVSKLKEGGCRMKTIFLEENFKTLNENTEGANLLEELVYYVQYNILNNIKNKFETLSVESVRVLLNYYITFWKEALLLTIITIVLSVIMIYFLLKKIINDQNYINIIFSYLYINNADEQSFLNKISLFKDIILGVKGKTMLMFDNFIKTNTSTSKREPSTSNSSRMKKITVRNSKNTRLNSYATTTTTTTTTNNRATTTTNAINNNQETNQNTYQKAHKLFFISKIIIIAFFTLFFLILSLNLIFTYNGKRKFDYSIIIAMNFLEKIPKIAELFIYSQLSVIVNDINFISNNDSLSKDQSYLNYYDIQIDVSKHSQLTLLNNSFYSKLYLESIERDENIDKFTNDKGKNELKLTKEWESKINEKNNFCINSAIGAAYFYFKNYSTIEEVVNEMNKNAVLCKVLTPNINEYGLKTEFDYYYQELTNLYSDFALKNKSVENIAIFLNNNLISRMTNTFEISFKNIFQIYSHFLMADLNNLYDTEIMFEKMFSLLILIVYIIIFLYIVFGVYHKNKKLKDLMSFFSEIILNTMNNYIK